MADQIDHPYIKRDNNISQGKPNDELAKGTLNSVLKQAGIKK